MTDIKVTRTIRSLNCGSCGILFGLEANFMTKRQDDGQSFYCPNGDEVSWNAVNAAEQTERDLKAAEAQLIAQGDQLRAAIRDAEEARAEQMRVRSRIAKGVCPCCNRFFRALHQHMQRQHPDFEPPAVEAKVEKPYRCSCGMRFASYAGLRIHQGRQRSEDWDKPSTSKYWAHLTVTS